MGTVIAAPGEVFRLEFLLVLMEQIVELHAGFGGDTTILGDSAKTYFYGFKIESDGGGGSGSGWVDDDLNSTANFDTSCEYRWTSSSNPICDPMAKHYMTRVGNTSMYYEQDVYNFAMFSSTEKYCCKQKSSWSC